MITVKKLKTLPKKICLRKCVLILQEAEDRLSDGSEHDVTDGEQAVDVPYVLAVAGVAENVMGCPPGTLLKQKLSTPDSSIEDRGVLLRACNSARHFILTYLGAPPSEWDLFSKSFVPGEKRLPLRLYLEDIRSPFNVGSMFRSAAAFGAEKIVVSPDCASPGHPRALRSAMGCVDMVPWEAAPINVLESLLPKTEIFALELGGTPVDTFAFPRQGIMIVGSEELGISPEALCLADKSRGRVSIPLPGFKGSLNVSVACGIVLHWWSCRLKEPGGY